MIVPPLAVLLGAAIGALIRNRDRAIRAIAIATPVLAVAALIAQFVPGGAETCRTGDGGTTCQSVPAVELWSPLAFAIAVALIVLAFAPLAAIAKHDWGIGATSALLQAAAQIVSFGGFLDWAPALLATIAVAFAVAWSKPNQGAIAKSLPNYRSRA